MSNEQSATPAKASAPADLTHVMTGEVKPAISVVGDRLILRTRGDAGMKRMTEVLRALANGELGSYLTANYFIEGSWPVDAMNMLMPTIDEWLDGGGDSGVGALFAKVKEVLHEALAERRVLLGAKLSKGVIEFEDMPVFVMPGTEVVVMQDGIAIGGVVRSSSLHRGMFGSWWSMELGVITNFSGGVGEAKYKLEVNAWTGLRPLSELPVRMLDASEKAELTERGRVFDAIAEGAHNMSYKGQLIRNSWWGPKSFRADGRVMVDAATMSQVDNSQHGHEQRHAGVEGERRRSTTRIKMVLSEDVLWRVYPYVLGFSFAAKQWGVMSLDGLSAIKWRDDAFEQLVLPEAEKELVSALVETNAGSFSDIVEGKGGGTIFLLHGPPGQGKTLTAETVAEKQHRPLYSISVGELGVGPDELEKRLREILDVATTWDAVLLLDEADIFLEARDEKDIVRNAMVGVFLRLLEYHQGVLFLTTNRVRNIDQAFYSRISVGIAFGEADAEKRRQVWKNLLAAAGVEGLDLVRLGDFELNGRQIKNTIRLATMLAKSRKVPLDMGLVEQVVKLSTTFESTREAHVKKTGD